MPKNKSKQESSSESDSGPEDKNPPPSKKSKPEKEVVKENEKEAGEPSWTLENLRQVRINTFRGRQMVDIREYYEKEGKHLPGKKGISLTPKQWRRLLEVAEEVTNALTE